MQIFKHKLIKYIFLKYKRNQRNNIWQNQLEILTSYHGCCTLYYGKYHQQKMCVHNWSITILHPVHIKKKKLNNIVTWMHSFPFIFLWFMYQNVNNSLELWNNTRIYEIFYTLNVGFSFITPKESCNNQRPRCDIACYKSFIPQYFELNAPHSIV